jgi:D-alanine-D-alanine ligase
LDELLPRPVNVAVLMGGRSAEREVSLNTGTQVAAALATLGHDVLTIDSASGGFIAELQEASPDVVFICLHGRLGEDGTVQGMLELLDLPYTGSGVLASAMAMDKVVSKAAYTAHGIPTPPYVLLRRGEAPDESALTDLGPRTVVKPACEGSAIGVHIVHDPAELPDAVEEAFTHDDRVVVERFVEGVEVTVGVLGNESKYGPGMSQHLIPARVPQNVALTCQLECVASHRALGCRGMSRTDTIVTPEDVVWVLETNTIPGMTSTSLLPDAARAAGIAFPDLCERLVAYALEDWRGRKRV